MNIEKYDSNFDTKVGNNFKLEELFADAVWAEGPAWSKHSKTLVFSDVRGNQQFIWHENYGVQLFRKPSHFANGNAFTQQGDLITCEHQNRCISQTTFDKDGKYYQVLTNQFDGKRLNSPNDVIVKSDGTIWFTDPPYGILSDAEGTTSPSDIIGCWIYCFDPSKKATQLATFNVMRPNGLAFTPDEKQMVVADMSVVEFPQQGLHELVMFDVENQKLTNRRTLAQISPGIPDGFCISSQGIIYCSCGNGLVILDLAGNTLGRIILDKCVSNCCFGDDEKTLFITATNSVYRLSFE